MEIMIRVNGTVVEGVPANSVKLSLNNPDPLKFSEASVSYSGSIEVPRTEVNDMLFRSERYPQIFSRTAPYYAELLFGGLQSPFNGALFRARVSATDDGYTIELIETISKLSDIKAPVIVKPVMTNPVNWGIRYDDVLNAAYPFSIIRPTIMNAGGTRTLYPSFIGDTKTVTAADYVNAASTLVYKGSHNGTQGISHYPIATMRIMDGALSTALERITGSTFDLRFNNDCFIITDEGVPSPIYLRSNVGSFAIPYTRVSVNPDGTYVYKNTIAESTPCIITPIANETVYFGFTRTASDKNFIDVPSKRVDVNNGYFVSFYIAGVGTGTASATIVDTIGFSTPYDIVQAYCKAFCWAVIYDPTTSIYSFREFINPQTSEAYRQNWTGRIDEESIKVSELEGAARIYNIKTGDLETAVAGYAGAISGELAASESALPVSSSRRVHQYATMLYQSGSTYYPDFFFTKVDGYRAMLAKHYNRFSRGWQISAKMYLSYFDIAKIQQDAIYFVGELNSWFYLRTLQNWDASSGECTVTLIAVNN